MFVDKAIFITIKIIEETKNNIKYKKKNNKKQMTATGPGPTTT